MPWGRVDDTYYDHPKLDRLDASSEWPDRLAAAGLNALAWSWCNRFLTDGHVPTATVRKLAGGQATATALASHLVAIGLWEEDHGGYLIHDFLVYNDSAEQVRKRRADEAARKAAYRANKRSPNGTPRSDGTDVPPAVPPSVPPGVPAPSRAQARGRTPVPSRPVPSRPTESLERIARGAKTDDRTDVQALLDRGWAKVTRAQRKVLDEVMARHDVTGPAFAAEVIRATPPDADPLKAVMQADTVWQEAQRRRADVEESGWSEAKARERAEADKVLADLGGWT